MITAQLEILSERWEELGPLLPLHWEELAVEKDRMPLDIDRGFYDQAEARGDLVFVTLREEGALLGYFLGNLGHSPHYQSTRCCKMDVVYLMPEHRGLGAGKMLLDFVHAELKRRGVKMWWMGSKNHKPIEMLFQAYGFDSVETYFAKWIGD